MSNQQHSPITPLPQNAHLFKIRRNHLPIQRPLTPSNILGLKIHLHTPHRMLISSRMSGSIRDGDRWCSYSQGSLVFFNNVVPCTAEVADAWVNVKVLFLGGFDPAVVEGVYRGDGIATCTAAEEVFISLIECENRGHLEYSSLVCVQSV